MEIAKQPFLPPPAPLLCFSLSPPLCSVAGAVERPPARVLRRAGFHASPCCFPPPSFARAGASSPCHTAQSSPPAATSPPRWHARCSGRRSLLSRARALQKPQHPSPPVLSPPPRSHAPERATATHRTPASLTPPSTRFTAASPPPLSTPLAPLHPRAASKLLLVDQFLLEPPRPRAPPP